MATSATTDIRVANSLWGRPSACGGLLGRPSFRILTLLLNGGKPFAEPGLKAIEFRRQFGSERRRMRARLDAASSDGRLDRHRNGELQNGLQEFLHPRVQTFRRWEVAVP